MPATAIALSASSNVVAASAMAKAHRAECTALIAEMDGKILTTGQKQEYADCIRFMYPKEMGPTEAIAIKVFIVIGIIGFFFAIVLSRRQQDDWWESVMFGFAGMMLFPATAFFLCLIAAAICFLFT